MTCIVGSKVQTTCNGERLPLAVVNVFSPKPCRGTAQRILIRLSKLLQQEICLLSCFPFCGKGGFRKLAIDGPYYKY